MSKTKTAFDPTFDNVEIRDSIKVAALDIGSNSFHLVVARIVAGSVQILHRVKQKVRLGDGLGTDGALSEETMQRGLNTLKVIAESLQGFEPQCVRVVATHALRKASNAKEFLRAAKDVFPFCSRKQPTPPFSRTLISQPRANSKSSLTGELRPLRQIVE